ncbi:hypothetical protein ACFQER_10990 [Halomicroarcula sp. GCM10025894]|uniref:hypothetical protein n=1 Tax=Halomicroarcula sp. GCM10025894 TaxID=3252673 RepID=UPI00361B3561
MQRNSTTRRGVLTVAGGALVALAGCSNSGGQSGTPTETDTESGGIEPTDTETAEPTETEAEQATEDGTETPTGATRCSGSPTSRRTRRTWTSLSTVLRYSRTFRSRR